MSFCILHLEMAHIRKIGNDTNVDQILNRDFVSSFRKGYIEVGEDNFCLPVHYQDYEEKIRTFEVHDDDVFITGHPKTGTTWVQEMIWLLVNNLDYAGASKEHILSRSPQLELSALFDYKLFGKIFSDYKFSKHVYLNTTYMTNPFETLLKFKRPQCIKSHLHWSLLPEQIRNGTKQPKIITVLRNPADVCVSLYYHSQTVEGYKGTFEDFCELFLAGRVSFGPFWKQVLSFWSQRHRPNLLIIKYEEMKNDLPGIIIKVCHFLEKSLTEREIEKLALHLSFETMKNNTAAGTEILKALKDGGASTAQTNFLRSGKVGDYKAKMSPELIHRFEVWTKENLAGTGLLL